MLKDQLLVYFRKPPCLPPSKTKRYRVMEPRWLNADRARELLWKRHVYLNALQSIRQQFRRELEMAEHGKGSAEELIRNEQEEFRTILAENERRNVAMAKNRSEPIISVSVPVADVCSSMVTFLSVCLFICV